MSKIDPEKTKKIWSLIKTIIELIIAALTGAATAVTADAAGLLALLS